MTNIQKMRIVEEYLNNEIDRAESSPLAETESMKGYKHALIQVLGNTEMNILIESKKDEK